MPLALLKFRLPGRLVAYIISDGPSRRSYWYYDDYERAEADYYHMLLYE